MAKELGISIDTVRRWRKRDDVHDCSHTAHRLNTTMTEAQEAVVIELRWSLLLPLDDLLVATREFINLDVSRAGLDRCLRRHGISRLVDLLPKEETTDNKPKTFKSYDPGFVHVDIKYLPQMPDETFRCYLFEAIDRATRWVSLELRRSKSAQAAHWLHVAFFIFDKGKFYTHMSDSLKKILFVTQLDIWSMSMRKSGETMGNQSLYNTLMGYARHGYEVHVLTSANRLKSKPTLPKNIIIHRHPLPGQWAWRLGKAIFKIGRRRAGNENPSSVVTDLDYRRYLSLHKVLLFYIWMSFWILPLLIRHRFCAVYGYEMFGTPVAWFWGRFFRRRVISRFQGTLMSKYLKEPKKLHYNWTHWMPMRLPVDLLIMTDDGTQGNRVLEYLGVPKERWVFLRNGVGFTIDPKLRMSRDKIRYVKGISENISLFTSASRMTYWKRIDRIIRAAALVPVDRQFLVVLIGDGEERQALKNLASDLGVSNRVRFEGPLPHTSVIEWHSAADVLISTFDVSNVGNQILEAQVLGKPYITVNTGDTSQIIKHEQNGILVEDADDIDGIAKAMIRLIDNPKLCNDMADSALAFGKENIQTWEQRMENEISIVESRLGIMPK